MAIDVECYRLRKYIGAYVAAMNGTDCIVFTAGVGENSPLYREKICGNLNSLGIAIDKEKNDQAVGAGEREIGSIESGVKIFVIPTNEELVFAEDAVALLQNRYDIHTHNSSTSFRRLAIGHDLCSNWRDFLRRRNHILSSAAEGCPRVVRLSFHKDLSMGNNPVGTG